MPKQTVTATMEGKKGKSVHNVKDGKTILNRV
jgi:hypothetical protein